MNDSHSVQTEYLQTSEALPFSETSPTTIAVYAVLISATTIFLYWFFWDTIVEVWQTSPDTTPLRVLFVMGAVGILIMPWLIIARLVLAQRASSTIQGKH